MFDVSRSFMLHCSHIATKGDPKCRRMHGHTFQVTLDCQNMTLDEDGFAIDFFDFDRAIGECIETFDHRHLNDIFDSPTCENLARAIYEIGVKSLPELAWVEVDEIGIGKVRFTETKEES